MPLKKVLAVVGARPQFVKLAPVVRAFDGRMHHVIVHTGQHYDDAMSKVFFEDLSIPVPGYNLGMGSGTHAVQTASIMTGLEQVMMKEQPDIVVVYGDTNSTLAGALVGAKLNISVAHIEAGLRSFNRSMPEEVNRIIADRVSRFLFCPTETAIRNLSLEGMDDNAYLVGDVMLDALRRCETLIDGHSSILGQLGITAKEFYLVTVHRASNTDNADNLGSILKALDSLDAPVIFPLHPRTRKSIELHSLRTQEGGNIHFIEPLGYLDMLALQKHARKVLTDSGGVQKEAYILGTPCVTLRNETEWVETLENGWNILAGVERRALLDAVKSMPAVPRREFYGDGRASNKIAEILLESET